MVEKRKIYSEPNADEPDWQGPENQQPGSAMGGSGGGVTPMGEVSTGVPRGESAGTRNMSRTSPRT